MSSSPLRDQLKRIEKAYFYQPGKMTEVHSVSGTVSPHTEKRDHSRPFCLVSGNGNRPLAEAVALLMGAHTHHTSVTQYSNGEVNVRINESVLGADVYIIQSTVGNEIIDVNTALMELLLLTRKMRLSNAKSVTVIAPFFGYARQDRKTNLRGPISASAVARMIVKMGADRVASLDLHSNQIQGFFDNIPVDNLLMAHEFARYLRDQPWFDVDQMVVVSPDAGGVERAKQLADILQVGRIVTIVKRRIAAGKVDTMQSVGEVAGFTCIIVDDMVDTGGTLVKACELLKDLGAVRVTACCVHGILTDPCSERINNCSALQELVVSDSIPQEEHQKAIPKLKVLTIAPLIAAVIHQYMNEESVSSLFSPSLRDN
ncbi:N-terminal domain of ribose phosphate pyrophosphokinase/Phosphoribosyl transferase domain [Leishmania shawi]|uniref:ribose-phosphate diphosphokinase n=1 Tax=Leishmania shawi TaxID=5680 RepID=A0AAW3C6X9_9TRYP